MKKIKAFIVKEKDSLFLLLYFLSTVFFIDPFISGLTSKKDIVLEHLNNPEEYVNFYLAYSCIVSFLTILIILDLKYLIKVIKVYGIEHDKTRS